MLAGLLYSSNIIDADVRDIVQLSVNTVCRKNQLLLNAAKRLYTHISNFKAKRLYTHLLSPDSTVTRSNEI